MTQGFGLLNKPGARLHLASRSHVKNKLAFNRLAYGHFWDIVGKTIAAIGKNIGLKLRELATNAHIIGIFLVSRKHYPVHATESFYNLRAFVFRHKSKTLLFLQPVIVVNYHHQLMPELFGLLEHPHMAN